jgi:hypothetical protein
MYTLTADTDWLQANQDYLTKSLAVVRGALERYAKYTKNTQEADEEDNNSQVDPREAADDMPAPAAIEMLCIAFNLSPFERDVLLLCAGMELESTFAPLCASAQGDPLKPFPTFSLALAALSNPHWSALTPAAPLRRWRLIEVGAGSALTLSPLRIDERVLHYLAGVHYLDERLVGIIEPLRTSDALVPSHRKLAERLAKTWSNATGTLLPVVQLCGSEAASKRAIATAACESLGLNLNVIHGSVQ